MKMTRTDRVMAIMRHPQFLKDYEKYLSLKGNEQEAMLKTLCMKWKEDILFIYTYYKHYRTWKEQGASTDVYDYGITMQGKPAEDRTEGRYLYLKVDLTKTREVLKSEFENILKSLVDKRRCQSRETDPILNHWEIYDEIEKIKKTQCLTQARALSELAEKRSNIHDKKWDDPLYEASRRQLDRAYKKAHSMVQKSSSQNIDT
jgi:hypothetical protein